MNLPPLNAVRAFDAVARLGSVRAAAEELSVTPAAVSQQVRALQWHLGVALTCREGRGLALTDTGRDWHEAVSRHLQAIADAAARLRPGRKIVQVTAAQSLAVRWLVPRLPDFTRQHGDIEVGIDASNSLADLPRGPFDLALRMGAGRYRDTETALLFDGRVHAVASPAYVRTLTDRHGRFDWSKARLLHEAGNSHWSDWFAALRIDATELSKGLFFSHTMLALDAAVEGQGVALAPLYLADRELREGRLVLAAAQSLDTAEAVFLAWPVPGVRRLSTSAAVLRDWLLSQARTTQTQLQRFAHDG